MNTGHFEIQQNGNLIVFRPEGGFSLPQTKTYAAQFEAQVAKLEGPSWGLLSVYGETASADPGVQQRVWNQLNWCLEHGCDYIGFVVTNEYQERLVEEVSKNLPFKDVKIFQDEQQGLDWITQKLAS